MYLKIRVSLKDQQIFVSLYSFYLGLKVKNDSTCNLICGGVFGELHLSWCCVCVWCCICGEGGGSVECNS